jgi:hypothetical protein
MANNGGGFGGNSSGGFAGGSSGGFGSNNSASGLSGGGNGTTAATQPGTIVTEGFGNASSGGKDKSKRISSGARLHRSPILER